MAKGTGFKYRGAERKVEDVVRRAKTTGGSYDSYLIPDAQMFKPREGENTIRILPPTWEDTARWGSGWEIDVFVHYSVGPDNATYLCLDKMRGEVCPVCEARRDATDEKEAQELRASRRQLCWVIDRDNEKAGPQVWSMPLKLFREINTRSVDKKTGEVILVDDPEEGYDITFTREGSGLTTNYGGVDIDREGSPLHHKADQADRWLDFVVKNPLPEILNYYSEDHIKRVLFGQAATSRVEETVEETVEEAEEEEVADEDPPFVSDTPRRRSRVADEVEEESEGAEEESGEDEDQPVRSARQSLEALKARRGQG